MDSWLSTPHRRPRESDLDEFARLEFPRESPEYVRSRLARPPDPAGGSTAAVDPGSTAPTTARPAERVRPSRG